MKFSTSALFFLLLAFSITGCDSTSVPGQVEKPGQNAVNTGRWAADPPQKQVENILKWAHPTPQDMPKDESGSTLGLSATAGKDKPSPTSETGDGPVLGGEVYRRNCFLCHDLGVAGAPVLGKPNDWASRTVKGRNSLIKNAIRGFQGSKGVMPPKGGNPALSDAEVEAAVLFMLQALEAP